MSKNARILLNYILCNSSFQKEELIDAFRMSSVDCKLAYNNKCQALFTDRLDTPIAIADFPLSSPVVR